MFKWFSYKDHELGIKRREVSQLLYLYEPREKLPHCESNTYVNDIEISQKLL